MDLDFSEEQEMLRDMVRGMCSDYSSIEVVRAMEDDPQGFSSEFWKQLAELDLLGLILPEGYGGSDQSMLEAAILYEEFGRSLAPSPHFASAVLSAGAILRAGSDEQKRQWLPRIASGDAVIVPAWLEPKNGHGARGVQLRAAIEGDRFRLEGTKLHVPFASSATRLLTLVRTGDSQADIDLVLIDPASSGVELVQQLSLASDTQYKVAFSGVDVPVADRLGAPGSGWATWDEVMHDGIILAAAQAIGGARRALEMTADYAKEREQFDKPLAAFQAISHYLADAATAVEGGTTLVHEAAWARSQGHSIARLAPMAKLFACQTFRDVTAMGQQVFGGVGFTLEYDIQLYFRRAKQLQLSWWDSRYLEELIAADVLD
jgi:alkylation response protein AidB-like acyl-CoA dehydrogenase